MNNTVSIAIIVTRNGLGDASAELQQTLAKNYFSLLQKENYIPNFICFYGDGVKLTCTGSPVIEDLKSLEKKGTKLIICKTCLIFYHLLELCEVGMVGTMHDIIDIQFNAGKVFTV